MSTLSLRKFLLSSAIVVGSLAFTGVAFAAAPTVIQAKITGPNTVTILYSEPVVTSLGDYSAFAGDLAGRSIVALSGNNTSSIALVFNGSNFAASANGSLSIAANTISVADRLPYGGSATIQVTDGQPPAIGSLTINSNNMGNALAKAGNTVTINFTANEIISNLAVTIAGHTVSVSGIGSGPYSSTYTMTSGDTEGVIPVSVSFSDAAKNTTKTAVSITSDTTSGIGSITSDATASGTLKVGDTIVFTMAPRTPSPNATVSGSYNGTVLNWFTNNGGITYAATYTVPAGAASQTLPLQISNVVITDASGHASEPAYGSDIAKKIDTTLPIITEITPVPTVTANAMPIYTFSSTKEGTIQYGGDCGSPVLSAAVGLNTVILSKLIDGLHNNCTVTVTDLAGNVSNKLYLSGFTVATSGNYTTLITPTVTANPTPTSATPAVTASYAFTLPLKLGSTGTEVSALQTKLTLEKVYTGPINGSFGPLTQAAVKKYQKTHGLEQLGSVGPGTRASLNK